MGTVFQSDGANGGTHFSYVNTSKAQQIYGYLSIEVQLMIVEKRMCLWKKFLAYQLFIFV